MSHGATTNPAGDSMHAPESAVWESIQDGVRSFREAWRRGERPAIEAFAIGDGARGRRAILAELIHEEIELLRESDHRPSLASYLGRFPEIAVDPDLLAALAVAESEWLRRHEAATPADPPTSPRCRIGRYELGEVIGRGAFGVVHRAYDTTLRRDVALKRPRSGAIEGPEDAARFLREARAAAGLRHPNIVPIHDAGQADGELYLVSDLIAGRNLAEELAARRPAFRRSAGWVADLAEALAHAHAMGLIHRDVKPSNVLIDAEDRVYLTDFGLARSDAGEATLTVDGQVIGTPAYMAPEQASGQRRAVDARTDVYSLGVILYELLTGARPFAGAGPMLLARIREEDPRPPRRLDPTIPRDLETVCLKAMAKEPARRYATAAALAADLKRWSRGEPVLARPAGPLARLARRCRRRPLISGLAAALLLAVVAGFAGVTREWRRAERERARAVAALEQGRRTWATLNQLNESRVWVLIGQESDRARLRTSLLEHYRAASAEIRHDPILLPELAREACLVAELMEEWGSAKDAGAAWGEAGELLEEVLIHHPDDLVARFWLANSLMRQGRLLRDLGRSDRAEATLHRAEGGWDEAVAMARRRLARAPDDSFLRHTLADCEFHRAQIEMELGRRDEAVAGLRRASDIAEALFRDDPAATDARRIHALTLFELARLSQSRRPDEATALNLRALGLHAEFLRTHPQPALVFSIAVAEDAANRPAEALRDFARAAELLEWGGPGQAERNRQMLATCYHVIGRLHVENGRPGEALEPYRKAIAIRGDLWRSDPENASYRDDHAGSSHRLGEALENLARFDEALTAYRQAIESRRVLRARLPAEIRYLRALDEQFRDLARLARKMGRPDLAADASRERRTLHPNDAAIALGVAGELARASLLPRPGEPPWAAAGDLGRWRTAVDAMTAWRDAARIAAEAKDALPSRSLARVLQ